MGKTLDYLLWRGDLLFSKDPFNDIDALILALLCYLPFKNIVPDFESNKEISLKEAAALFFSTVPEKRIESSNINPTSSTSFDADLLVLLKKAAECPRFEKIGLSRYDEDTDFVVGRQFGAMTYSLHNPQYEKVVAFRGTDNSFIGWKEDFELAYLEQIPAQESACRYLERAINIFSSKFIICGHSKGGNLAMYAGSHINQSRQNRVSKIINFDGPGFDFSIVKRDSFLQGEHKITSYIPEESMVGLLLESVGQRVVVSSTARYINQHNALTWQVDRTNFVHGSLSGNALLLEQTLNTWLTEISIPEREMFLEALFDILGASEGAAIKFDPQENLKDIKKILTKYVKLDKKTKALLTQVFFSLSAKTKETISATIKRKIPHRLVSNN